jgi:microcompartment protein CcmL/EutN
MAQEVRSAIREGVEAAESEKPSAANLVASRIHRQVVMIRDAEERAYDRVLELVTRWVDDWRLDDNPVWTDDNLTDLQERLGRWKAALKSAEAR